MGKYDRVGELSTSQITTFLRCKRQWWLQYFRRLNYSDGDNKPVTVGLIVHKAMEQYYSPGQERDPVDEAKELIEQMVEKEPAFEDAIRNHGALAITMIHGYYEWVKDTMADQGILIESVEERMSVPLGNTGFVLTGRPDARGTRFGQRIAVDHKTVDDFESIPATAQINHQFLTYFLLEFLLDKEVELDAVIINMFRRVNQNNPNAKPPYFDRYEVRYNRDELRNHWYHVLETAYQIQQVVERLDNGEDHHRVVPPTPMKSCKWDCSYRMICPMFDDGSQVEQFISQQYSIADEPE